MRKTWNHAAPDQIQPCPIDNTTEYVLAQVSAWVNAPLIHPESAMEIAAWYAASGNPAVTAFSSTGTIVDGLAEEIEHEMTNPLNLAWDPDDREENINALRALLAYVKAVKP